MTSGIKSRTGTIKLKLQPRAIILFMSITTTQPKYALLKEPKVKSSPAFTTDL